MNDVRFLVVLVALSIFNFCSNMHAAEAEPSNLESAKTQTSNTQTSDPKTPDPKTPDPKTSNAETLVVNPPDQQPSMGKASINSQKIPALTESHLDNANVLASERYAREQAIDRFAASLQSQNRVLQYTSAARYTHLQWRGHRQYSVGWLPIRNYSGIPIEARDEDSDYYNHGKIPAEISLLFQDLLLNSRQFNLQSQNAEYQLQLIVESYQHPYDYAPDDHWVNKASDNLDRAFTPEGLSSIKLSLIVSSGSRKIPVWQDSVEVSLGSCDLNLKPQPLSDYQNQNATILKYIQTTMGQSFVAASNFLILKAIERLDQTPLWAEVDKKMGDELILTTDMPNWNVGDKVDLYYRNASLDVPEKSAGQLQIISTSGHQALAYPISIHSGLITEGDQVALKSSLPFEAPNYHLTANAACAPVAVAQVDSLEY